MSELLSLTLVVAVVALFAAVVARIKNPSFPAEGLGSLGEALRALLRFRRRLTR